MLSSIPFFSCLDPSEMEQIEAAAMTRRYPRNTILMYEGEDTGSFYLVIEGSVKVSRTNEDGKSIILSILGPGDYFGEMALIDNRPRSATVTTRSAAEMVVIPGRTFRRIISNNGQIITNMLKGTLTRLRHANEQIASLAFKDVYGRMAMLFNNLGREEKGMLVIDERLTHQEIATMIGASREMVSRIMKELVNGDYLLVEKQSMVIQKTLPYRW